MVLLSQDLSATLISAWRKEELRNKLKALKKSVDDMDRHRKAQLVQNVSMCICIYIVWMSLSVCVCVYVCVCISIWLHATFVPSWFLVRQLSVQRRS